MRATIRTLLLYAGVLGFILGMTYLSYVPRFRPVVVTFFTATGVLLFAKTGIQFAKGQVDLRRAGLSLLVGATQFFFAWAFAVNGMASDFVKFAAVLVLWSVVLTEHRFNVRRVRPQSPK